MSNLMKTITPVNKRYQPVEDWAQTQYTNQWRIEPKCVHMWRNWKELAWVLQLQLKVLHLEMTPQYLYYKLWLHKVKHPIRYTQYGPVLLKIVSWLDTISIGLQTISESQPLDSLCCDFASNPTWLTLLNLLLQCNYIHKYMHRSWATRKLNQAEIG